MSDISKKSDYTKTEPSKRGLCEYKIYGDNFKDIYGTEIKVSDVSSPDPSVWITIMSDKMKFQIESTGEELYPYFRIDRTGAKQFIKLLKLFLRESK